MLARFDLQGIERQSKKIFQWSENILDTAIEKRMNSNEGKEDGTGKFEQKDFLQFLLELREKNDAATSISMTLVKALLWVCPIFYSLVCTKLIQSQQGRVNLDLDNLK